jgi:hypothetical protein
MSSTVKGFTYRDISQRARAESGRVVVNPGKTLPATATGNLFTVTGIVQVTFLVGVVSTILQAANVSPTLGVTGSAAAIAAAPAAPYNGTAVGAVITMPLTPGGALPVPVTAQGTANGAIRFVVNAAAITITTATTVTGAITWILGYVPLFPKGAGVVTAV